MLSNLNIINVLQVSKVFEETNEYSNKEAMKLLFYLTSNISKIELTFI